MQGLQLQEGAACVARDKSCLQLSAAAVCQSYHGIFFTASSWCKSKGRSKRSKKPQGSMRRNCRCLHSDVLPWPSRPPCSPSSPNLTLCFLHSFHEHCYPHCCRPHRKFSSAQGWGGDRWRDIQVPPSCRRISKAVSRCEGECRCTPSPLHTDGRCLRSWGIRDGLRGIKPSLKNSYWDWG